jgi:hypothetical protein
MPLLVTNRHYKELDRELRSHMRQILHSDSKIMSYDIGVNGQNSNNPYVNGNVIVSKENSLIGKMSYEGLLLDHSMLLSDLIKKDPEIKFVKSADSLAFSRYYKLSLSAYKKMNYHVAMKNLELALKLRRNDTLADLLMNSIKEKLLKKLN